MSSNTKSESAQTATDRWWIVDGNWLPNGRKYAGPFSTRDDALTARTAIEKLTGTHTFFVDSDHPYQKAV